MRYLSTPVAILTELPNLGVFFIFRLRYRGMVKFPRLPRFDRTVEIAPLQFTERDLEIVHFVGRYRLFDYFGLPYEAERPE